MSPVLFAAAYAADLIAGDPRWIPHPVVCIGRFIGWLEGVIRRSAFPGDEKKKGVLLWCAVVGSAYGATRGVITGCSLIHPLLGVTAVVVLASLTLATRSLYMESKVVLDALKAGDIHEARQRLSMIVGRDTEELTEREIYRAVIETVSENLSDGIVAPMFYLALGGVPLAMAYKSVNTLDSMVGYKNEKYRDIGWFSARLDDLCNWVPARLTGLVIVLVSFVLRFNGRASLRIMIRDGRNHTSPNSGAPEAAMAGSLGVQLGGKIKYFGKVFHKPTIGDRIKEAEQEDVLKAWTVMLFSSLFMALICMAALWIFKK